MIKKLLNGLWRLEIGLVAGLMLVISALVFTQVLTRYVFMYSLPWLEELTRFLMVWMVMLGTAVAVKEKQHIVIDIASLFLKTPKALFYYQKTLSVIGIVFSVTLAVLSHTVVERTASYGQLSGAMRAPMYLANGSFLVAAVLMSLHYLEELLAPFRANQPEGLTRDNT